MIFLTRYNSPVGRIVMASDGNNLIGLWFDGQKYFLETIKGEETIEKEPPVLQETREWLDVYFSGKAPGFTPRLTVGGSAFQRTVCEAMQNIPYGETTTYGAIARGVADQTRSGRASAQAVGGAVGRNPISLVIPCHRVVGSDGSLTGYAGGLDRKRRLLEREGVAVDASRLCLSKNHGSPAE